MPEHGRYDRWVHVVIAATLMLAVAVLVAIVAVLATTAVVAVAIGVWVP